MQYVCAASASSNAAACVCVCGGLSISALPVLARFHKQSPVSASPSPCAYHSLNHHNNVHSASWHSHSHTSDTFLYSVTRWPLTEANEVLMSVSLFVYVLYSSTIFSQTCKWAYTKTCWQVFNYRAITYLQRIWLWCFFLWWLALVA